MWGKTFTTCTPCTLKKEKEYLYSTSSLPPKAPMLRVLYLCVGWGGGGVGAPRGHQWRHQVTGFPVASVSAPWRTCTAAVATRLMFLQMSKYFFWVWFKMRSSSLVESPLCLQSTHNICYLLNSGYWPATFINQSCCNSCKNIIFPDNYGGKTFWTWATTRFHFTFPWCT